MTPDSRGWWGALGDSIYAWLGCDGGCPGALHSCSGTQCSLEQCCEALRWGTGPSAVTSSLGSVRANLGDGGSGSGGGDGEGVGEEEQKGEGLLTTLLGPAARSSEGQQTTPGATPVPLMLVLSRPYLLCSPPLPQLSSSLRGTLSRPRQPDPACSPSSHGNPVCPLSSVLHKPCPLPTRCGLPESSGSLVQPHVWRAPTAQRSLHGALTVF